MSSASCIRYHGNAYLARRKIAIPDPRPRPLEQALIAGRPQGVRTARSIAAQQLLLYVDSSTNGSYVISGDQGEIMVRRKEIEPKGNGRISFGASMNDPKADFADFEHL
ncbi:MAG: hypothetical protein IPG91_19690 [Ideonella sp.]|nr:hypothetical protein [Ideonella sp.]